MPEPPPAQLQASVVPGVQMVVHWSPVQVAPEGQSEGVRHCTQLSLSVSQRCIPWTPTQFASVMQEPSVAQVSPSHHALGQSEFCRHWTQSLSVVLQMGVLGVDVQSPLVRHRPGLTWQVLEAVQVAAPVSLQSEAVMH